MLNWPEICCKALSKFFLIRFQKASSGFKMAQDEAKMAKITPKITKISFKIAKMRRMTPPEGTRTKKTQ